MIRADMCTLTDGCSSPGAAFLTPAAPTWSHILFACRVHSAIPALTSGPSGAVHRRRRRHLALPKISLPQIRKCPL